MKFLLPVLFLSLFVGDANAVRNRPAMISERVSPRHTASINQLNNISYSVVNEKNTATTQPIKTEEEKIVDRREAERNACINNNIGIGNTFVWASKYTNTLNYANMIEDIENPENNVCFVRVELTSDNESRVNVADIESKYFMWGEHIECGSWVNEKDMEKRILDARKGARIGGIVASTVGGAGLGVGSMELFGNRLIGGALEGQKSLNDEELIRSKLLVLKKENPTLFREYIGYMKTLRDNREFLDPTTKQFYNNYSGVINEFAGAN